jgi:GT2 family glycosyltransferase
MEQFLTETGRTELQRILLPILVLYNTKLCNSVAYQSYIASARHSLLDPALIAVYDNSPIRQVNPGEESLLFAYKHDPSNSGIAAAYNWALDLAQSHGFPWLLLLDQDSILPTEFLKSTLIQINLHRQDEDAVAIVPVIRSGGSIVSPMRVGFGRLRLLPDSSFGIQSKEIMAINSGTVIRCDFVRFIGGFSRAYWLDYLDHWLFRRIYESGNKAVVSKCCLGHKLSVQDYRNNISTARYRSILNGEAAFITTHKSHLEIFLYLLRLLCRIIKQLFVFRKPQMAAITATMFRRIATHPARSLEVMPL